MRRDRKVFTLAISPHILPFSANNSSLFSLSLGDGQDAARVLQFDMFGKGQVEEGTRSRFKRREQGNDKEAQSDLHIILVSCFSIVDRMIIRFTREVA